MFTALRKLVSHNENQSGNAPPGMQAMAQSLQKKFSKGVQYNMKIIIKGDRNVGKTCLFYRLQGLKFKEEYLPTQEIQVTSIQWNYKATDDVVKVEVWDVVDKGKKKKRLEGLKFDNIASEQIMEEAALDAEFVDVYKNTNGVVMMIDMTKHWTFDYVQRELPKVPPHIPVLVFANHRDMGHHRVTSEDDVRFYIEGMERPPDSAPIRYMEGSMRNSFGLKFLHKFFNLPFLQLQRQTLLRQLDTNRQETELTNQELDLLQDSEEQNYELFMEAVNNKRRQIAEQLSPTGASTASDSQQPNGLPISNSAHQVDASSKSPGDRISRSKSSPCCTVPQQAQQHPEMAVEARVASPLTVDSHPSSPSVHSQAPTFMSRLFKKGQSLKESQPKEDAVDFTEGSSVVDNDPVRSVDDFVPDDHLDRSFLEDDRSSKVEPQASAVEFDDSDSENEGNPMVAEFQDDLDPDDSVQSAFTMSPRKSRGDASSEDDEAALGESKVTINITRPTPVAKRVDRMLEEDWLDSADDTPSASTAAAYLEMNGDHKVEAVTDAVPIIHSLEFEDLSILERGFPTMSSSGSRHLKAPRRLSVSSNGESLSDTTISETTTTKKTRETSARSVKKRRDRNGERRGEDDEDERRSHTKKKHRKHKSKDDVETKTKKSSKKSSSAAAIKTSNNELEDFLNDGIARDPPVGRTSTIDVVAHDYESL